MTKWILAISAVLCVAGGAVLLYDDGADVVPVPVPPIVQTDPLTVAQTLERAAEVSMLRELAGREFPNDREKMEWINSERKALLTESHIPYTDAIAEAIIAGTVAELADQVEGGK